MPVIHRLGDANTGGGVVIGTNPNSTVFANSKLVSINGSIVSPHGPHTPPPPILTANGCSTVRAHGIPVNKAGDKDTCGDPRADMSGNVFLCSFSGGGRYIDHNIPIEQTDPTPGYETTTKGDVQIFDNNNDDPDDTIGPPPENMIEKPDTKIFDEDETPPPPAGSPSAPVVDCSSIDSLPSNYNWSNDYGTFAAFANSFSLSTNFTVADLTIKTAVSRYPFTSNVTQASGLTQKQILQNLCYLAKTVLEPMRSSYGSYTITSGFRNKTGSSQHNKGQAADIQFLSFHGSGNTGNLYLQRAQDVRDTKNYDQMILEWFGRNPWIHVSVNPSGHRRMVLTQVGRTSYQPGLRRLG